jgi:hypothetical protein
MTPEEALACLQDEACLECIGQDALDEATEALDRPQLRTSRPARACLV